MSFSTRDFECFVLENDYSFGAYLLGDKALVKPKPWTGNRAPAADLIFTYDQRLQSLFVPCGLRYLMEKEQRTRTMMRSASCTGMANGIWHGGRAALGSTAQSVTASKTRLPPTMTNPSADVAINSDRPRPSTSVSGLRTSTEPQPGTPSNGSSHALTPPP